jgi:predicted kinase
MIFLMHGLPASGKSTKRREMLADAHLAPIVAVNKDEIRKEKGITPGDFKREKEVQKEEQKRVVTVLESGTNLIVDNTHNSFDKYHTHYSQLAVQYGYKLVVVDLTHVPLEECIRRDALRPDGEKVGEKIIRSMHEQFYKGKS